jgi:23S rRNA-/tRNA-specific pseudouridylate synthase
LDVYCSEFGSYPNTYYKAAILQGRIQVSDKQVDLNYKIKGNDVLSHTVHRHEPGVVVSGQDSPITIIAETDDLVVVDKPGTLPVHPCGAYQQNSLLPILEPQYGKLHIIHRLDRLTSGLVLLAKNSKVAQTWGKALMERATCQKVYLARVRGKFPLQCPSDLRRIDKDTVQYGVFRSTPNAVNTESFADAQRHANALAFWLTDRVNGEVNPTSSIDNVFTSNLTVEEWLSTCETDNNKNNNPAFWFHLACPTRISNHKDGICHAGGFESLSDELYLKSVKPAQTSFGVVRYDPDTDSTIVLCRPQTGRTHQIRLHLQYLGHPIANDPCYGGDLWFGDAKGKLACQEAAATMETLNGIVAAGNPEVQEMKEVATMETLNGIVAAGNPEVQEMKEVATISDTPATEEEIASLAELKREEHESLEDFYKKTCVWCARNGGTDRSMLELLVRSRGIWLHALKYLMVDSSGNVLDYRTDEPSWS